MGIGEEPITVFILDNHARIREALRRLLEVEKDFHVIGEAGSVENALHLVVPALAPDVIVMDMQMPGMNGLETTRRLRGAGCRSKVVVLTEFGDSTPAIEADAAISKLESMETGILAHLIRLLVRPTQNSAPTNVGVSRPCEHNNTAC